MKYKWWICHVKTENLLEENEVIKVRIAYIEKVCHTLGYKISSYIPEQTRMIIIRVNHLDRTSDVIISINLSNFDTITTLTHPKKGRTKLKRRGLSLRDLTSIIYNPRLHTGLGRYING